MKNRTKQLLAAFMTLIIMMPMTAIAADDSNTREVGVEWNTDFTPCGIGDLYQTKNDAEGFYNGLGSKGWTKRFNWGNADAWEKDYEKQGVGGWDYLPLPGGSYALYAGVDTVDFAYYSGHGSTNAFWFGTNHDGNGALPCRVDKSEVSWGETDLEWIVLSVCDLLKHNYATNVFSRWGPALKGLHQILSYDTISYDYAMGSRFVFWMTKSTWTQWPIGVSKKNIRNAWHQANIEKQPGSVWSAVLSTNRGWNDMLPGYGSQGADGADYLIWQKVQN